MEEPRCPCLLKSEGNLTGVALCYPPRLLPLLHSQAFLGIRSNCILLVFRVTRLFIESIYLKAQSLLRSESKHLGTFLH